MAELEVIVTFLMVLAGVWFAASLWKWSPMSQSLPAKQNAKNCEEENSVTTSRPVPVPTESAKPTHKPVDYSKWDRREEIEPIT